jgi:hypothetical protein
LYNLLANATIVLHFLFIVFVVCGGLLVTRWPQAAFVHLPAAVWGTAVEIFDWICPLTPLENHFIQLAGDSPYSGDFIVRYLLAVIYPENLTAAIQQLFGGLVVIVNIIFYTIAVHKHRARKRD